MATIVNIANASYRVHSPLIRFPASVQLLITQIVSFVRALGQVEMVGEFLDILHSGSSAVPGMHYLNSSLGMRLQILWRRRVRQPASCQRSHGVAMAMLSV